MATAALAERPRVLHAVPESLRVHLPAGGPGQIESLLRQVPGVLQAHVNPLTGNALILFDPQSAGEQTLPEALGANRFSSEQIASQASGPPLALALRAYVPLCGAIRNSMAKSAMNRPK
jgi:hypothetical protein